MASEKETPISMPDLKNGQVTPEIEKRVIFTGSDSSNQPNANANSNGLKSSATSTARSVAKSTSGLSYTTIRLDDCFSTSLTYIQL